MKPHLLLLPGAMGSHYQLLPLKTILQEEYEVSAIGFSGHGGLPKMADTFTISSLADEGLHHLDTQQINHTHIFGYSMGGYVALWLARYHPTRIDSIVTLGTKLHWDIATVAHETKLLDPDKVMAKVPKYAESLAALHGAEQWQGLMLRTAGMMRELAANPLTDEDYTQITALILLCRGEADMMVSEAETLHAQLLLPKARYQVLEATPHPLEQVDQGLIASIIRDFIPRSVTR